MNQAQFAKDIQTKLATIAGVSVYDGDAPRDGVGAISVTPPFVVYSCAPQAPNDEANVYVFDLLIDVWGNNGWAECYTVAEAIDNALNGTAYYLTSGLCCCDQNGQVCSRAAKDPDDQRIRRLSSQYQLRVYPTTTN